MADLNKIHFVNNEIGVIQSLKGIGKICTALRIIRTSERLHETAQFILGDPVYQDTLCVGCVQDVF